MRRSSGSEKESDERLIFALAGLYRKVPVISGIWTAKPNSEKEITNEHQLWQCLQNIQKRAGKAPRAAQAAYFYIELTQAQIAALLGISTMGVSKRFAVLRKKF